VRTMRPSVTLEDDELRLIVCVVVFLLTILVTGTIITDDVSPRGRYPAVSVLKMVTHVWELQWQRCVEVMSFLGTQSGDLL
jgi:hypothetical protein